MVEEINKLRKANESLGGVFEVRAFGLVPGLGSHVSLGGAARRPDRPGRCSRSRPIKGCGIGDGFDLAGRPGSEAHDEIFYSDERGYYRETNRSGGVEGGMTTGEPLVVRCAMKPLPTLTKPLRSVDIATREPAQALRERTDSCTVPAAGVVGEAMVAFVLADAYRVEVRRRPHRRRPRRRCERLRAAHRLEAVAAHALVFIGFMGAGKTSAARAIAGRARRPRRRRRRGARARLGHADRGLLRHARRGGLPRGRGGGRCASCSSGPPAPVRVARRRRGDLRARAGAAAPAHGRLLDVDVETAWQRAGGSGARWPATASASPRCTPSARPLYDARRRRDAARLARGTGAPRAAALQALARAPAGTKLVWATSASGELPRLRRRGAARRRASGRVPGRRFAGHRRRRRRRCYARAGGRPTSRIPAGEEHKTLATVERLLRGLAAAGIDHGDHVVALGGGVVGDLAGFCAAIYQRGVRGRAGARPRSSPRWTPPTAARRASTCPRARTTSAPTTSRPPCSSTRRCWRRCRRPSWPRATPRSSRPR